MVLSTQALKTINKNPIILNCFSRGGSNILWNFFISHPSVCHPLQETLEIFGINLRSFKYEAFKSSEIVNMDLSIISNGVILFRYAYGHSDIQ